MPDLPVDKQWRGSIVYVDKNGNPTSFRDENGNVVGSEKIEGMTNWSVDDPAKATVFPDPDGFGVVVKPLGAIKDVFSLKSSADADVGEGVRLVETETIFVITAGGIESASVVGVLEDLQP